MVWRRRKCGCGRWHKPRRTAAHAARSRCPCCTIQMLSFAACVIDPWQAPADAVMPDWCFTMLKSNPLPPALRKHPSDQIGTCSAEPEYYAFMLVAGDSGQPIFHLESMWVGWHDFGRRIEIRRSRLVRASFAEGWRHVGLPYRFIRNKEDWVEYLLVGGGALVERELAERIIPYYLKDHIAYPHGARSFSDPDLLEPGALNRAPSAKLRMAVLTRDKRRCRICGRRPEDHLDLELHVHHIRPWRVGGLTNDFNLITLCQTCHKGLDPHFDPTLFDYIETGERSFLNRLRRAVDNYRGGSAGPHNARS